MKNNLKFYSRRLLIVNTSLLISAIFSLNSLLFSSISFAMDKILRIVYKDNNNNFKVIVDEKLCTLCGECVDVCIVEGLEIKLNVIKFKKNIECLRCESCIEVCASGAINILET